MQQRADLLAIAAELFSEKGVDRTLIDEMAERAGVSAKTVYNYFPNKNAIIVDLIKYDRVKMRYRYEKALEMQPDDLVATVKNLIDADICGVTSERNKRFWRELLAAEPNFAIAYPDDHRDNRKIFTEYVAVAISRYERAGLLAEGFQVDAALDMVYALLAFNFRNYVCSSAISLEDVRKSISLQVKLLVNGWLAKQPR